MINDPSYPKLIRDLPEANLPIDGVLGHLFQGEKGQICFFDFEPNTEVPAHSHGDQWGVVLEGAFNLTIGDQTYRVKKGDTYHIPAGTVHSATFDQSCKVLDFFADRDRYAAKW